jgi:hypothetical protein
MDRFDGSDRPCPGRSTSRELATRSSAGTSTSWYEDFSWTTDAEVRDLLAWASTWPSRRTDHHEIERDV